MPKYRILIHGKNFLVKSGKKDPGKVSFDTIRYVEAENEKAAEAKALEIIRSDAHLRQNVLNTKEDPPLIYVDSVDEVQEFDKDNPITTAFRFYPEEEEG